MMKNFFYIVLVLLINLPMAASAAQHMLFNIDCETFDEKTKQRISRNFTIVYEDKNGFYFIGYDDYGDISVVLMTDDDVLKLRQALAKYFEWEKLALEKNIKIEKAIPDVEIRSGLIWSVDDIWHSAPPIENKSPVTTFVVFSAASDIIEFVITTTTGIDFNDPSQKYKRDNLHVAKDDAKLLYDMLEPKKLKSIVKDAIDKKKQEDEIFK